MMLPPGYSLRIAGPLALGASAETMEVGNLSRMPPLAAVGCADAGRQAHHLLPSQTTAAIPGSHGVCGLFLISPLAFPAA
jgi:hypothetical protein